jgi:hypothetical protein
MSLSAERPRPPLAIFAPLKYIGIVPELRNSLIGTAKLLATWGFFSSLLVPLHSGFDRLTVSRLQFG